MFIDSHCHLDFPEFAGDLGSMLNRARSAGVSKFLTIATTRAAIPGVVAIAEAEDDVFCAVGVHPHEAEKDVAITADELIEIARHPKIIGIGETGLDYHYEYSPRAEQEAVFRAHIEAARETGLPVIVHTRDADDDTRRILADEMKKGAFTGLIHCFTSSAQFADFALEIGFALSFSGILTFKSAKDIKEIAARVPLERFLIETDAPYLAPIPFRGRRNEPAFVVETAKELARLKGLDLDEIGRLSSANFNRLFTKQTSEGNA